jgi:large subunit ribosomal protein L22
LKFSKKLAAKQIHKVLQSAVANAEQKALRQNEAFDADRLRVKYAVINEGQTLKRFTMAAMGRGTPIKKRTSHVEIHVASEAAPASQGAAPAAKGGAAPQAAKAAARGAKAATAAKSDKPAKKKAPAKTKKRSK